MGWDESQRYKSNRAGMSGQSTTHVPSASERGTTRLVAGAWAGNWLGAWDLCRVSEGHEVGRVEWRGV